MSDVVRANVWRSCRQRGVKRLIMVALADEVNSAGSAEFQHDDLASKVLAEPETISAYLRQLAKAGEIEYEPASGRGTSCKVWMPLYGEALASAVENPVKAVLPSGVPGPPNPVKAVSGSGVSTHRNPVKAVKVVRASGVYGVSGGRPRTVDGSPHARTDFSPPPYQPSNQGGAEAPPVDGASSPPASEPTAGQDEQADRAAKWEPFYSQAADDVEGWTDAWKSKQIGHVGEVRSTYGVLAGLFGEHCQDDLECALSMWRRFVGEKREATFSESGQPIWSGVSDRNVVKIARRWLKDSPAAKPRGPLKLDERNDEYTDARRPRVTERYDTR